MHYFPLSSSERKPSCFESRNAGLSTWAYRDIRSTETMAKAFAKSDQAMPEELVHRVVIEGVSPETDGGRYPVKKTLGERVTVDADIFCDGHEMLGGSLLFRRQGEPEWAESPMTQLENDRWTGHFTVGELGFYEYTIEAWIDRFAGWRRDVLKKFDAGQEVGADLLEGAAMVKEAARGARGPEADWLGERAEIISGRGDTRLRLQEAVDPLLARRVARRLPHRITRYPRILKVMVDRERARYGAWYEIFPRSCADEPGRHGNFDDLIRRLPYIASMGFDVLYLPPVHPVGRNFRKGPNNSLSAGPRDPGSPWAIGSNEGGHKSVHPELGTLEDFDRLVAEAKKQGLELALDIAFQCSPDHPYVREHPEWFRHRVDGTIKYAENPPKKYQDIYPLDFECENWRELWQELKSVLLFWVGRGVRIFRVDNPHTKTLRFWEWAIAEVQAEYPETIFLSEAFTRPKIMRHLAKGGFSQSYTYFTWRNGKQDLTRYLTELTRSDMAHYFRPNLFANTPDILNEYLQFGGRGAFMARLVLAATLGASYGIYGPVFEWCDGGAQPGTEEYRDTEKFQIRHWDWSQKPTLKDFIAKINAIRRENPALHFNDRLEFHPSDNEQIIFYGKTTPDFDNIILVAVNLDPHHIHTAWLRPPIGDLGLDAARGYQVHDLLSGARYLWQGEANFVRLDPSSSPAHIFRVRRKVRTERDFDYFL